MEGAALSAACAFCATPLASASGASTLAPARLVPFRLTREQAESRLARHLHRHWLLPRELKESTQAASLHAVMVPFYAYSGTMESTATAEVGVLYSTGTGDNRRTHVEWFPEHTHQHVLEWRDHLVSASRGVPEHLANRLEPFDLAQALVYSPQLIAALEAEHPSIDQEEADAIARKELDTLLRRRLDREAFAGVRTRGLSVNSEANFELIESVLLPIWIASYRSKAGPVSLFVNGQTGAVVGKLPRDWRRLLRVSALLLLGVVVLLGLIALAVLAGIVLLGVLVELMETAL